MRKRGYLAFLIGTRRDLEEVGMLVEGAIASGEWMPGCGLPPAIGATMRLLDIIRAVTAELAEREDWYNAHKKTTFGGRTQG